MIDIEINAMSKEDVETIIRLRQDLQFWKIDKIFFNDLEYFKINLGDFITIFEVMKDVYDYLFGTSAIINTILKNESLKNINYKKQFNFLNNIELLFNTIDKYNLKEFTIDDLTQEQFENVCNIQSTHKLNETMELKTSVILGLITNSILKRKVALSKSGIDLIRNKILERIKLK